jgi:hypothetical protein
MLPPDREGVPEGYGRGYYLYDADGQLDFDQIEENNHPL